MKKEIKKKIKVCNHSMVRLIRGGYSYYRCNKCNYVDEKKTFPILRVDPTTKNNPFINMKKEIKIKKITARIILGIGALSFGYFWLKEPAQKYGWSLSILGIIVVIFGIIMFIKILWKLLDWAFET